MVCQLCGKKIGSLRRLVDREFCSAAHRHEARTSLDRSLADFDDADELWTTSRKRRASRSTSSSGHTASALALLVVVLLILAILSYSGGTTSTSYPAGPSTKPAESTSWFRRLGDSISRMIRSGAPTTLKDDFHSGISDWISSGVRGLRDQLGSGSNDWSYTPEGLKPGRLRIWKRSTELKNYEIDFLGQIDRKSMGWAFRALDVGNYYGTKLSILRSGDGPNAGMVRYVMLNGREVDRVNLPLPIKLTAGEPCRVRVNVKGDHFVTSVNGQVISSWSDQRLARGGVGFFTDEGESATVRWVSISERDSLLGRVLSYFSIVQLPVPQE